MRGLKPPKMLLRFRLILVASFTDAWIETHAELLETAAINVASFTDAWIETC